MKTQKILNILTIIALLSIVSLSAVVIPASIKNNSVPESSAFTGFFYVNSQSSKLFLEQDRGSDFLKVEFWTQFYKSVDANWNPAKYVGLNQITLGTTDCYWLNGTSYDSDFYVKFDSNAVLIHEYQQFTKFEGWTRFVPINNTMTISPFFAFDGNDCYLTDDDEAYSGDIFYGVDYEGLVSGDYYDNFFTELTYKLNPIISINSSHFNADNTRIKIYDQYHAEWIEQTIDQISLSHPLYKIRIYSKEDNTLLYEDSEFQQFSVYREIDISSLKYTNNAPEPVNIDLFYNQSVDWGTSENDIFSSYDYKMSDADQIVPKEGVLQWGTSENPDLSDWTIVETVNGTATIVENITSHKNVLYLNDDDSSSSIDARYYHSEQITGYVDFFYYRISTNVQWFQLAGASHIAVYIYLCHSTTMKIYNGSTFIEKTTPTINTWTHFRIFFNCTSQKFSIWQDGTLIADSYNFYTAQTSIIYSKILLYSSGIGDAVFDAFGYSWSGCKQNDIKKRAGWLNNLATTTIEICDDYFENNLHVVQVYNDAFYHVYPVLDTTGTVNTLAFNIILEQTDSLLEITCRTTGNNVFGLNFDNTGYIDMYGAAGSSANNIMTYSASTIYNIRVDWIRGGSLNFTVDSTQIASLTAGIFNPTWFRFRSTTSGKTSEFYLNSLYYGWQDVFYKYPVKTTQVNPYSTKYEFHEPLNYLYQVSDLYGNVLENNSIQSTENEIIYTPAEVRSCFISLADQQKNYLHWENYKIYVNDTFSYSNIFYREIGSLCNISIYDKFDNLHTSTIHTVERDVNYINLTITLYSLKIYNQQELFLHLNISQDSTEFYWSEWVAPDEIVEYRLVPDTYNITITNYEDGEDETIYELNFVDDDILLISSANTLGAVIQSFENLNTTLDEQFTYVSLNFTNIDSAIGNQTVIIDINFANVNSTLDQLFISQQNSLLFINSTVTEILLSQQNSFEFLNATVNNLYTMNENSFSFINSTTGTLLVYTENSFSYINSTIDSISAMSLSSFSYLNSTIENSITYMAQNFTFLNSEIGNNQLELLTNFAIVNSNVTNNSINIMNNILAINSSISNLIADLSSNVFLVNNSIYTAILTSTTELQLDNNNILGNLSITFQQNEFLTDILKSTLFSELLNWTGVGYDYSLIENQIETVQAVNNMRNETLGLFFKYQNEIDSVLLSYGSPIDIKLPANSTDYRIYSYENEEFLTEWEEIPDDGYINFGYYEREEPIVLSGISAADYIISGIIFIAITVFIMQAGIKNKAKPKLLRSDTYHLKNQGKKSSTQTNDPMNALRRHF